MGKLLKIGGTAKSAIFFLIVIGAVVYTTFFTDYNYLKVVEYDREVKRLKAEIKACRDSCELYQQKLRKLDSDPETVERIVREEYNMKRDNEDLYLVNE